jgi:hypothetical protein
MTWRLKPIGIAVLAALLAGACGGTGSGDAAPTTSSVDSAAASETEVLAAGLISQPTSGGPWTVEPDDGTPVHLLQPVCAIAVPGNAPRSLAHAGRMFYSGEPFPLTTESFPIARHSRDRFVDAQAAAAFIDIHRQALTACETWTYSDGEVTVDYTVTEIDVTLPGNGVAFRVTEQAEGEQLVNLTAMYQEDDVVSVLYYAALEEADEGMLQELVGLAAATTGVEIVYGTNGEPPIVVVIPDGSLPITIEYGDDPQPTGD